MAIIVYKVTLGDIVVRKNIPVNTKSKNLEILGGRLAFERESLSLTVSDFAMRCGVAKQTQIKYEAGENFPDTRYLEGADRLGVDVMYILTGSRTYEAMSNEQQNLLEAYADAPEELKRAAFSVLISPYATSVGRARIEPGYYRYEIKGEEDTRYVKHRTDEQKKEK